MERNHDFTELRLLLEELCCDLCRFEHVARDGVAPEEVQIDREVAMGGSAAFADIRVSVRGRAPYFVEVKYGYSEDALLGSIQRKYFRTRTDSDDPVSVILVIDRLGRGDWASLPARISAILPKDAILEIWDEARLLEMLRQHFGVEMDRIEIARLVDVRQAIDRAKGLHAFGRHDDGTYEHDPLKAQLLWHFGFWRLRQIREARRLTEREIVPPGLYQGAAVVIADLCSFSSFVRDSPRDGAVISQSLTAFYSKARYQITNSGGMLYQFVGDQVIGVFGIPDRQPGYIEAAYSTARALCSIGRSVENEWQRQIDRVQATVGIHVGMAIGDMQLLSLRPFSRTHIGFIGDSINVAARLMANATADEIVVTNGFFQSLPEARRREFSEQAPLDGKNVGRIKAWKTVVSN